MWFTSIVHTCLEKLSDNKIFFVYIGEITFVSFISEILRKIVFKNVNLFQLKFLKVVSRQFDISCVSYVLNHHQSVDKMAMRSSINYVDRILCTFGPLPSPLTRLLNKLM